MKREELIRHIIVDCSVEQSHEIDQEIPCRETQIRRLESEINSSIRTKGGEGHILYLYGQPGTGKSASVSHVCRKFVLSQKVKVTELNGHSLRSAGALFLELHRKIKIGKEKGKVTTVRQAYTELDTLFRSHTGPLRHHILILDEFDSLIGGIGSRKDVQSKLHALFDWPSQKRANLTIICIANKLCMPQHLMPRSLSRLGFGQISFSTYNFEELQEILFSKIRDDQIRDEFVRLFATGALEMMCRRIAALSGDFRDLVQLCKLLMEDLLLAPSRTKVDISKIKDKHIRLCNSRISSHTSSLPIYTKILVACILLVIWSDANDQNDCVHIPMLLRRYEHELCNIISEGEDIENIFSIGLDALQAARFIRLVPFLKTSVARYHSALGPTPVRAKGSLRIQAAYTSDKEVLERWGQLAVTLETPLGELLSGLEQDSLIQELLPYTMSTLRQAVGDSSEQL